MRILGSFFNDNRIQAALNARKGVVITSKITDITPGDPATVSFSLTVTDSTTNKPIPSAVISFLINGVIESTVRLDHNGTLAHTLSLPPSSGTYKITLSLGSTPVVARLLKAPSMTYTLLQNIVTLTAIDEMTQEQLHVSVTVTRLLNGNQYQFLTPTTVMIPYVTQEQYGFKAEQELAATSEYAQGMGLDAATNSVTQTIIEDLQLVLNYLPFIDIQVTDNQCNFTLSASQVSQLTKLSDIEYKVLYNSTVTFTTTGPSTPPVKGGVFGNGWIINGTEFDHLNPSMSVTDDVIASVIAYKWITQQITQALTQLQALAASQNVTVNGNVVTIGADAYPGTMGVQQTIDLTSVDLTQPVTLNYNVAWSGSAPCAAKVAGKVKIDLIDASTGNILETINDPNNSSISGSVNITQYLQGITTLIVKISTPVCLQQADATLT
jgi:hypothetical protein